MSEIVLPMLREELTLYSGPRARDGSPTWTIHDPPSNKFFFISWLEFEILSNWHYSEPEKIIEMVNSQTTLNIDQSHVDAMAGFLAQNSLLITRGEAALKRYVSITKKIKKRDIFWLLKNYLFFRVPLINPDNFLSKTYNLVKPIYSVPFQFLIILSLLSGLYLVSRQWDTFISTFIRFFTFESIWWYMAAIGFCKVVHEFGHAYTAHRYGCRVSTMGIMFLVLMPVLFTDTTESWKLAQHSKRLKIAAAGMITEIGLASVALLVWNLLPDSPARNAAFMVATSAWVITLAINLNPFMKFDGYYIVSDWLQTPNLQDRSFKVGKWWLREQLFGLKQPPPERLSQNRQIGMVIYAFAIWIYRFFLFVGIAFLVYKLFFKLLGIILFLVEIIYFIGMPIFMELKNWWQSRGDMYLNRQTFTTFLLFFFLVGLLFIPWKSTIFLPATWLPSEKTVIYSQIAGEIKNINIKPGEKVSEYQPLVELASMDLEHQINQINRRINIISWQIDNQGLNNKLRSQTLVLKSELEEALSKRRSLEEEKEDLIISAPFSGKIAELSETLQVGQVISKDEPTLFLISPNKSHIEAYVEERYVSQLSLGMEAMFYPEITEILPVHGVITRIDSNASRLLSEPYLAVPLGGTIPAHYEKTGKLVPSGSIYRVIIEFNSNIHALEMILRGKVRISIKPESIAQQVKRQLHSLLIRESSF